MSARDPLMDVIADGVAEARAAMAQAATELSRQRSRIDALETIREDLLVALKELLKNVEEFPFESISIEHPMMTGVPLARAAIAQAEGRS